MKVVPKPPFPPAMPTCPFHIGMKLYTGTGRYMGPCDKVMYDAGNNIFLAYHERWWLSTSEIEHGHAFVGRPPKQTYETDFHSESWRYGGIAD